MNLREIVFGNKRESCCIEQTTIGGIIFPLIKLNGYDTYIYGAGRNISAVVLYFLNCGIEVKGIFDSDPLKENKKVLDKIPISYPPNLKRQYDTSKTIVIINTYYFKDLEQHKIVKTLYDLGITKFYALNEYEKYQINALSYEWTDMGRLDYYRDHINALEESYNSLKDNESKKIMLEYIRAYAEFSVYKLDECDGRSKYFYGHNMNGSVEKLYKHLENEIWVNCGSAIGDNIFNFFSNGLHAKKIVAFEANNEFYDQMCKNLKYLPEKYSRLVHSINAYIDDNTNFQDILKGEKITLLNADIEGAELSLLKNLIQIITTDRPVLAVCVYHKASDLTDLFEYLRAHLLDYTYMLRKYVSSFSCKNRTSELVLYAIPIERDVDTIF